VTGAWCCGIAAGSAWLAVTSVRPAVACRLRDLAVADRSVGPGHSDRLAPSLPWPPVVAGRGRPLARAGLVLGLLPAVLLPSALTWAAAGAAGLLVLGGRAQDRNRLRARQQLSAQLPRATDLLAACLDAGASPADAVSSVAGEIGDPVAEVLGPVAGALRLGADPVEVWGRVQPELGAVARAFARAATTGAALADTVAAAGDEQRRRTRWAAEAAARRAGVAAVGPLMLCFLPAFLLVGVVPVVVGVASTVLSGLS
jgi:pilus assembly protein TadC